VILALMAALTFVQDTATARLAAPVADSVAVLDFAAFHEQVRRRHPVARQAELLEARASAEVLAARAPLWDPVLGAEWKLVLLAALAALGARTVVASVVAATLSRTGERMPRGWLPGLAWGGLRGALSLVLALSLPAEAGHKPLIVAMTAGTVVLSLIGQGTTMPLLLRRLGITGSSEHTTSV